MRCQQPVRDGQFLMSFIRPEILKIFDRYFTHWGEAVAVLIAAGIGIRLLLAGGILPGLMGGTLLALALLAFVSFRQRARLRRPVAAPGIVEITERRITYLAAEGGGIVDLDALRRLEIVVTGREDGAFWVLWQDTGTALSIPVTAAGANEMIDTFAALPGLSLDLVADALASRAPKRFEIWAGVRRLH